ncbi:MAG: V-type ATP synthase subunit A [Pyrobaculum arsenaticum]|uniref:A-type ATP synthase subunit A n=3 Tax=Pyrobaculum TaxID=2276 RepID=AATA_PYRAR|nr:V-type ATP synthase subunit A [Pyrobaculum arsenaticum]A4WN96.1 RecName: Full=V-type ATP synthase alpha chain; AltName: Full=V-ATPase subunit A [Pyrobaculum arsenaticum DSM 13514]ABP51863.1 Sodium-transporting two-sector ATPase [Pyrobaculum arsenaticum DSM 13514]MCY0891443.1 V-type ATP synthase subunit A [Pyrobaculum arsenaticum]NYR16183.1 V-type ATP synthase subunit A [Pyrobaculum arsenaticum]
MSGKIEYISGPVVKADLPGARLYELVFVGEIRLFGEVVRVQGDKAFIQVYEDTTGLKPGEPVERTGEPLSAWLGPTIIGKIYDGVQRPLKDIEEISKNPFIARGIGYDKAPPLDLKSEFDFRPAVKPGDEVSPGDVLGSVKETELMTHYILYPPLPEHAPGVVEWVAEGKYKVDDVIARIKTKRGVVEVKMWHKWPVRRPRPFREKLPPVEPLITGVRTVDTMFPIAKGGAAAVPGPFGSGKTVMIRTLSMFAQSRFIIPVLCGERGNEAADALQGLLKLKDPATGRPLLERTTIIVNTSNMPVAAREASVYMGTTLGEYFRDQGYDVLVLADSTSRWAEAMREVALRIGEMPSEEGYPAYLPTRLAEFYERAGRVVLMGSKERIGSLTIAASVSPPGGDFTEPVTSNTLRFIGAFWPLSPRLAYSRHYPAIDWLAAFSRYVDTVEVWWSKNVSPEWRKIRDSLQSLLVKEAELQEIVRILGTEALSEYEKHILNVAFMIREGFLKQDAYNPIDTPSAPIKQFLLMKAIYTYYEEGLKAIEAGVPASALRELDSVKRLPRLRMEVTNDAAKEQLTKFIETLVLEIREKVARKS